MRSRAVLSATWYIVAMLGAIVAATLLMAPSLFRKTCPACGAKNGLDAGNCRKCGKAFPAD
ncbi:MAG: hypothetical protein GWP08_01400 [Nitrospiraceae bacterium]|nr:hypothetical protein [Nitrospiraceae bacterium]